MRSYDGGRFSIKWHTVQFELNAKYGWQLLVSSSNLIQYRTDVDGRTDTTAPLHANFMNLVQRTMELPETEYASKMQGFTGITAALFQGIWVRVWN
jgi:hypothetical protein